MTESNHKRFNRLQWLQAEIGDDGMERIAAGLPLEKPVQIEIHPYSIKQERPCSNDCIWCTRKYDRLRLKAENARGIDPGNLIEFIRSFDGHDIPEFALAGNSTEPLLYPNIEDVILAIKDVNSALRLYTNFQNGNRIVGLAHKLGKNDIVRVSLDAGKANSYNKTHCPVDADAYEKIIYNLEDLLAKRDDSRGTFSVILTYLINKLNCSGKEIESLMSWAAEKQIDAIRFIRPLTPAGTDQVFFPITQPEAQRTEETVADIQKQLSNCSTVFTFSMADDTEIQKPFEACHYWKMAAVLGSRGMFFPCTSTAVAEYVDSLGRSDINDPNFDFWSFWTDKHKWGSMDLSACPECTRGEFAFNVRTEQQ